MVVGANITRTIEGYVSRWHLDAEDGAQPLRDLITVQGQKVSEGPLVRSVAYLIHANFPNVSKGEKYVVTA